MTRPVLALLVALVLPLAAPGRARAEGGTETGRGPEVAGLRFAWPDAARARVAYRRTRLRTGARPGIFTARYELVAERDELGVRVATRGTTWRGELPVPRALMKDAIRASQAVVQRIDADGEFRGLDGAEALRPVLARVLEDAKVPPDQAERALALALAAARSEAEELWNLAVGFWTGAELRLGETYAMESHADLPLLSAVRAPHAVEFSVRRRVPCSARERALRCVEAVLRSVPDRASLERSTAALVARLLPDGAAPPDEARRDLDVESELVLVTDPATLLPRRLVWTRAIRLGAGERDPPLAEQVDRSEYDYRWLPPAPPRRTRPRPAPAATAKAAPGAG